MSVMIKRRLLLGVVIVLLIGATTIVSRPPAHGVSRTTTIVELQPASLRKDQCVVVTDPTSASDCGTGDGVDPPHICCSDGTTWNAAGDGTGGGSAVVLDINNVELSTDMDQIDVRPGDTNSIFTHGEGVRADELTIDPSLAWPTSDATTFWAVVYPDPAEGGSTSDGVQEAIDSCPAGGCIVQLDCATTYDMNKAASANSEQILISADDIWLRGCGRDSTVLSMTTVNTGDFGTQMIDITGDRIRLSDFHLLMDDICGDSVESCAAVADQPGGIVIRDADDVNIHNLRVTTKWGEDATAHKSYRGIWFAGASGPVFSQRGSVTNSVIEAMGRGLEMQFGDHIYVAGNTFLWDRPAAFGGAAGWQIIKYEGTGIQIIGNNFDMGTAIATQNPSLKAIALTHKFADVNANGEYAQIIGNTITNLTGNSLAVAIAITGYKHAFIHNNLIKARRICSTERGTDCTEATQAADCSSNDCIDTAAIGISFDDGNGGTGDANKWNIITGNTFEGFDEDGTLACSIVIPNATTDQDNEENIFANNVFDSTLFDNPTTDDGVCGDAATIRANVWLQNLVTGRDEQCVIGRGVAGECILSQDFSDTDGEPTVSVEGAWTFNPTSTVSGLNIGSIAGDPSTPVNGDIWYDTDANEFTCREDGSTVACIGSGSGATATTINDLLPVSEWIIPQLDGPQEEVFGTDFPRTVLVFDAGSDEDIFIEEILPADYDNTDTLSLIINWSANSTDTGNQGCWCVSAADFAAGEDIDPTLEETICADDPPTGTANERIETTIALTPGTYAATNGLLLRLFRDTDSSPGACEGGDIAAEMRFHGATLIYEVTL